MMTEKENVNSMLDANMNITTNPGSLKAKLNSIENILRNLNDEMKVHKDQVDKLKTEKENL